MSDSGEELHIYTKDLEIHYDRQKFSMSKMFMNVKEVMEVLEVSESYAYKLMKRLNRELQAMGCQTIAGKVDRKYFYEQFYGTRSNDGRN